MIILFESNTRPVTYMLWDEGESDHVRLYTPGSGNPPSEPIAPGSIANHMPYVEWAEFTGDDSAEQQILAGISPASAAEE